MILTCAKSSQFCETQQVIRGEHGWWQPCPEIGAPGYDPFHPDGANYNQVIGNDAIDPVSGSVPHRAYVCQVRRAGGPPGVKPQPAGTA